MARINIEDKLFKEPGFVELAIKLGSRRAALGAIVEAYILAQDHYLTTDNDRLIPLSEWKRNKIANEIIDSGLAEERENGIYLFDSEKQFAWLIQRQQAGKANKKKSKRDFDDRPITTDNETPSESSGSKPLTLSLSLSPTLSHFSNSNSNSIEGVKKITPDRVIDLFNKTLAGTGKIIHCKGLSPTQMKKMIEAFNYKNFEKKLCYSTLESWEEIFLKVKDTPRLTGKSKKCVHLATLDWLCDVENILKVENGKYDLDDEEEDRSFSTDTYKLTNEEFERLKASGEIR